jgi:hypothetical protein
MAGEPILISDLRGGVNDSDSPLLLKPNEMTEARNIDFRAGALGAKRRGSLGIDMTGALFDSPVIALFRHTPTNNMGNDELWGIDENGHLDRRVGGTWRGGVPRANTSVTIEAGNYDANAASLHGKLFIAAKGSQNRLLVWDGTVLRWAGFLQPPTPSVINASAAGTFTGTRYYRIRYTQQNAGGATLRRSEPSTVVATVPSGVNSGLVVGKPVGTEDATSLYSNGQTHWELEASLDNILFYRIATMAIATLTYTDTTPYAMGYSSGVLSETVGEYLPPGSARHVTVDEDRVLMAGSYFVPGNDATVWWTPVAADDGVGNDERLPQSTLQYITFDGLNGGGITALVPGINGAVYPFKRSRIYKMVRTGILASAYDPVTESWSRGATIRGAVGGLDENGLPCVYFLDDAKGLCRIGQRGVEDLAGNVEFTWKQRNKNAVVAPRLIHYPELDQVWYSVPIGEATRPSLLFVYETQYGASLYHDGLPATAQAFTLFQREDLTMHPVFGTTSSPLELGGTTRVHYGDVGTTDNGVPYCAFAVTRPFAIGQVFQKFGVMSAVVIATASIATVLVRLIRNMGVETLDRYISTAAAGAEGYVIRPLDSLSISGINTLQFHLGDEVPSDQAWSLDQLAFRPRKEEGSA